MELIVQAGDEEVAADLYRWLLDEIRADLVGTSVTLGSAPSDGRMGSALALLNLVVPNAISLSGLVVSIVAFRDSRRRSTGVLPQISIGTVDTMVVVDPETTLERLVEAVPEAARIAKVESVE